MNAVTSWAHITDEMAESYTRPMPQPGEVNNRVITGTLTHTTSGEITESGTSRVTQADLVPQGGGIIGTVQNNAGMPTTKITPDSTVIIPGFGRTSVKVAEQLGYISRNDRGDYIDGASRGNVEALTEQATQGSAQQQDQGQSNEGPELFAPALEEAYGELIADIPQEAYDSLMGSAVALMGEGNDVEEIASALAPRLASAMGIEPSRAQGLIQTGARAWRQHADATVKASGAVPDEFWEWAADNRRDEVQQAAIQHLFARNTKGYRALVDEYFDNTIPTVEALRKGGIPVTKQGHQTMVKLKGHWMSLESAVKARLV